MTEQDSQHAGEVEQLKQEYLRLMHAVQTGVEYLKEHDKSQTDPKHLKVGVNSALMTASALTKLLVDKGIITEHEYWTMLVQFVRDEVETYQDALSKHIGGSIALT